MKQKTTIITSLAIIGAIQSSVEANSPQPNVILILADDIGYGDVGCYGATLIKTPNIDKMAEEGRRFTDAHSASAVSTPSRYSLLTGQYPFRGNDDRNKDGGIWAPLARNSRLIIDTDILTMGKMFQAQGYQTACIGKWHLGFQNQTTNWNEPLTPGTKEVGFDYYFGIPFVSSAPPYVFVRNDRVVGLDPNDPIELLKKGDTREPTPTQLYPEKSKNIFTGGTAAHALYKDDELGIVMAEESAEWIKRNKENPFFLYLATPNIHHPFTPNEKFQGSSQAGAYGDYLQEFDWVVGEVLKALEAEGLADNTLVIVTSDNGGMFNLGGQAAWDMGHQMNGDLLGFKFDVWEGGHRVPFVAKWPNGIKAGSTSNGLFSSVDLFASFASLVGYKLKDGDAPDSHDMLALITGVGKTKEREAVVLSSFRRTHMSLRDGDWIYIPGQGGGGWNNKKGVHAAGGVRAAASVGRKNSDIEGDKIREGAPKAQLYNISKDPLQTQNVIEKYPKIAAKMAAKLDAIRKSTQTR